MKPEPIRPTRTVSIEGMTVGCCSWFQLGWISRAGRGGPIKSKLTRRKLPVDEIDHRRQSTAGAPGFRGGSDTVGADWIALFRGSASFGRGILEGMAE